MITAQVLITSTGNVITDEDGDLVSEFEFEWSCKKRKNG